ncbi:hypothetical protein PV392_12045 [Streptomyces sp. ME03-5709C]|nr:hypothetical protein [Streptomyces sp. ME03-5709C]
MKDSTEHDDWMDAALAERLLDGAAVQDGDARAAGVARLLAAATAALPTDPERERMALAGYRQVREAGTARRRRSALRPRARWVAGGLAAVFALGGVAFAAQSGTLPNPFHAPRTGPRPVSTGSAGSAAPVAPTSPAPPAATTTAPTTTAPTSTPPSGLVTGRSSGAPPTTPGPRTVPPGLTEAERRGLCQAYAKAAGRGEAMDAARQSVLERAAGGKTSVAPYCERVLGSGAPAKSRVPAPPTEGGRRR